MDDDDSGAAGARRVASSFVVRMSATLRVDDETRAEAMLAAAMAAVEHVLPGVNLTGSVAPLIDRPHAELTDDELERALSAARRAQSMVTDRRTAAGRAQYDLAWRASWALWQERHLRWLETRGPVADLTVSEIDAELGELEYRGQFAAFHDHGLGRWRELRSEQLRRDLVDLPWPGMTDAELFAVIDEGMTGVPVGDRSATRARQDELEGVYDELLRRGSIDLKTFSERHD